MGMGRRRRVWRGVAPHKYTARMKTCLPYCLTAVSCVAVLTPDAVPECGDPGAPESGGGGRGSGQEGGGGRGRAGEGGGGAGGGIREGRPPASQVRATSVFLAAGNGRVPGSRCASSRPDGGTNPVPGPSRRLARRWGSARGHYISELRPTTFSALLPPPYLSSSTSPFALHTRALLRPSSLTRQPRPLHPHPTPHTPCTHPLSSLPHTTHTHTPLIFPPLPPPTHTTHHSLPARYVCPITLSVMDDPVTACDGTDYERSALGETRQCAG
mgnify:CR=1 FL=1